MSAVSSFTKPGARQALGPRGALEDERLHGIRECVEAVLDHGIPGDVLVAGTRLGVAPVFVRAVLASNGVTDRWLWLASPGGSWCDLDDVRAALGESELLDDAVRFIDGSAREALPVTPLDRLAVVHLESGTEGAVEYLLGQLYPQLSVGGFVIVDGYATGADCREAVEHFRHARGIDGHRRHIGAGAVVWRKERA